MADGTVVSKGEGENIGGIGITLQHAPLETGLPYYTYTEYKHLVTLPDFPLGHKVRVGEEIGQAGRRKGDLAVHMPGQMSRARQGDFSAPPECACSGRRRASS
jgi:hypothetical protein